MDKPIISKCVSGQTRVYYIDTHKDRKGQSYISVSEIPKYNSPGNKKRWRIFIHAEHLDAFLSALQEVSETIKKNDAER